MDKETIILDNLTIGYRQRNGNRTVASGLSAFLRKGEMTCLLGQNGVGKSTLLKTLAGFIPSLDGNIVLSGKPLKDYTPSELARTLGVVLTDKLILDNMTVRDVVEMGRSPYTGFWGRMKAEDHKVVSESIDLVGIDSLQDRMIETLSDGERQKAMIAKALAQQTPVIFLDEPTAFLDFPSKVEIMQLLHRLTRQSGKSIFLSTHDVDMALQIADCIWMMKKNEPLRYGTPEDLSLDGTMQEFFQGREVEFDTSAGSFRIKQHYESAILLQGSGVACLMAAKALRRNKIEPIRERIATDVICSVNVCTDNSQNKYLVTGTGGRQSEAHSIREMLSTLEDYGCLRR